MNPPPYDMTLKSRRTVSLCYYLVFVTMQCMIFLCSRSLLTIFDSRASTSDFHEACSPGPAIPSYKSSENSSVVLVYSRVEEFRPEFSCLRVVSQVHQTHCHLRRETRRRVTNNNNTKRNQLLHMQCFQH